METLAKLFGSEARVKLMRLFLLNPDVMFDIEDVTRRSKVLSSVARKELALLEKVGFAKKKQFIKETVRRSAKKDRVIRKKKMGWTLCPDFPFISPLQDLLINMEFFRKEEVVKRFSKAGRMKLVVLSGVFIQEKDSRVDILLVGDNLKKRAIENTLRALEAEIGKELSYAFFETQDFLYRVGIYDKFVRDILDFPHEKAVNKLTI